MKSRIVAILGFIYLISLIGHSTKYSNFAQELGLYIVWDDSIGTVYDPLTYCVSGKDTIYAGAYSMKVPRLVIGTEFHNSFHRVYELPSGQYILVQRNKNDWSSLLNNKLTDDSCYIPTDDETLKIINDFNIIRFSEDELDSLKQSDITKYQYALFLNSRIEKYYLDLEKITLTQKLSNSGVNRVICKNGIKILLFNIDVCDIEYLTQIVSQITLFYVDKDRAYIRKSQVYSMSDDNIDSYVYDDSTMIIDKSIILVSPDRKVVPRVRIYAPRESLMLGLICSPSSEILDMPHGQYIMIKRPYYPPNNYQEWSHVNDTIYTPNNDEILEFIDDMNIYTQYFPVNDWAIESKDYSTSYQGGILSNLFISHYIPDLVSIIDDNKLHYTGENRIIVKDGIHILLYNILPQKIDALIKMAFQTKILGLDDEHILQIKQSKWYQGQDPTKITHLFTSPIGQTKITQDEYEKGVEEINRKGQNGLAK